MGKTSKSTSKVFEKKQTELIDCKYEFSKEEKAEIAEDMVEAETTVTKLKDELDSIKKQYQAQIREQEAKRSHAASKMRAGFELRPQECTVEVWPKDKLIKYIRLDNLAVAKERPATIQDLQIQIDDEDTIKTASAFNDPSLVATTALKKVVG